jgi:hypothetical protein
MGQVAGIAAADVAMEYRGVEYMVVQSISPNRWRWSVNREPKEKVGMSDTRETAIFRAKRFIDELIARSSPKPTE